MGGLRSYLLGVICAAIVCGLVIRFLGDKGSHGTMVKLIAGVFMAFTVIRPIADIRLGDLTDITDIYSADARAAVAEGEKTSRQALAAGIKAQCEAYILDKAEAMGLKLTAEVELSQDDLPVPIAVRISGQASPYKKTQLRQLITDGLGIEKEHQIWI